MSVQAETRIQNDIRLAVSSECRQVTLWRNHTGCLRDERGKWVTFGLAPGSADLVGVREVTITPDMVGQTIGQFVALEIKTPSGRTRVDQRHFLNHVRLRGGLAAVVKSVDEAIDTLR
jgi:hypothetical protein